MINFSELLDCADVQSYIIDHAVDMADFSTCSFSDIWLREILSKSLFLCIRRR